MMKVYIVFKAVDYEGDRIEEIYLSEEKAIKFIEVAKKDKIKECNESAKRMIEEKESQYLIDFWSEKVEDSDKGWRWNDDTMYYEEREVK